MKISFLDTPAKVCLYGSLKVLSWPAYYKLHAKNKYYTTCSIFGKYKNVSHVPQHK